MNKLVKYVYDIFGWMYRECKFLNNRTIVNTYYYDLKEPVKNKYGEFLPPLTNSIIQNKNVLISYYEIDNAVAISPFKINVNSKDASGKEHTQELTTENELYNEPSKHERDEVELYNKTHIGALPLLNCKFNPLYYEAQMEVKSIKEMRKAGNGLSSMSFTSLLFYGAIGIVVILVFYAIYTGAIRL